MEPVAQHLLVPDVSFDGGNMDCGGGLLLLIRRHIDPLPRGGLLEILSTDSSVEGDLPAWCRLTGNQLVSWIKAVPQRRYLVCKGSLSERTRSQPLVAPVPGKLRMMSVTIPDRLPSPISAPAIEPLSL